MTISTDALRLVPIDMQIESILHDLVEEVSAAQRGARVKARARQCCARGAAKNALLNLLAAAPASPPAYVRTPNEDDRLRRALYRLLDRHGAGPDVLSVIGSLWDTLDQGECTDLIEDWLITGKTMQAEGDIDEMLASIPEEAPASPLPEGGVEALIAELREARAIMEPFALLAVDEENGIKGINMNDPISKWLTIAQLVDARAFLARNGKGEG